MHLNDLTSAKEESDIAHVEFTKYSQSDIKDKLKQIVIKRRSQNNYSPFKDVKQNSQNNTKGLIKDSISENISMRNSNSMFIANSTSDQNNKRMKLAINQ